MPEETLSSGCPSGLSRNYLGGHLATLWRLRPTLGSGKLALGPWPSSRQLAPMKGRQLLQPTLPRSRAVSVAFSFLPPSISVHSVSLGHSRGGNGARPVPAPVRFLVAMPTSED